MFIASQLTGSFTGKGLQTWDVQRVTNMSNMFFEADAFNGNISIAGDLQKGDRLRLGRVAVVYDVDAAVDFPYEDDAILVVNLSQLPDRLRGQGGDFTGIIVFVDRSQAHHFVGYVDDVLIGTLQAEKAQGKEEEAAVKHRRGFVVVSNSMTTLYKSPHNVKTLPC